MKLLELFSGTQSMSKVFREHGWETYTVENDPYFKEITTYLGDVRDVTPQKILEEFGRPDVIWASPPCYAFSVASIGANWKGGKNAYIPKSDYAKLSQELVQHAIYLIQVLRPKYWFIENPRGLLRMMPFMYGLPRYTVTYCRYGDKRMKPTDIFTNHPNPRFKIACHNGDGCHEPAPRGSKKTGTQGLRNSRERAVIPNELCEHIYSLCE